MGKYNHYTALVVCAAWTAACATGTQVTAGGEVAPVRPIDSSWLPAGTSMSARLDQSIGTASSHDGDTFSATVVNPVYAQDGSVAVPAGSILHGHVTGVHGAKIPGEQSVIRLAFDDLQMHGRTYPLTASISNVAVEKQSTAPNSSTTTRAAVTGAAAGTVLGAVISGGELSKIITGGLLGAAAGTVISMGTGGTENVIPAASTLSVRTNEDVRIR
jgi:hypothetical protein